jgi:hypothetical protein
VVEIGYFDDNKFHYVYENTFKSMCQKHDLSVFHDIKEIPSIDFDIFIFGTLWNVPKDWIKFFRVKKRLNRGCKIITCVHETNSGLTFNPVLPFVDAIGVTDIPIKKWVVLYFLGSCMRRNIRIKTICGLSLAR